MEKEKPSVINSRKGNQSRKQTTTYYCKDHLAFTPKDRRWGIYNRLKQDIEMIFAFDLSYGEGKEKNQRATPKPIAGGQDPCSIECERIHGSVYGIASKNKPEIKRAKDTR